jgi:hypothetical protein
VLTLPLEQVMQMALSGDICDSKSIVGLHWLAAHLTGDCPVPPFDPYHERRGARRLQMGCKARIKSLHTGETHYGECVDLSVDGMAFRCSYVPQHGERLSVIVLAPLWVVCRASRWRPRWKCGAATR